MVRVAYLQMKFMASQSQQDFLRQAKEKLNCTWDGLAELSGIHPRALKTYRMPDESDNFRPINPLAKAAIERLLQDQKKK